jgi:hypothetical protein
MFIGEVRPRWPALASAIAVRPRQRHESRFGIGQRKEETMLRPPEPAVLDEALAIDDDLGLFDPSPEWFVAGLRLSSREDEIQEDGLGLRSLIEKPEALAKAWRTTGSARAAHRANRAKRRHTGSSLRGGHAARVTPATHVY